MRTSVKPFESLYIGALLSVFAGVKSVQHVVVVKLDREDNRVLLRQLCGEEESFWLAESGVNRYTILDDELDDTVSGSDR